MNPRRDMWAAGRQLLELPGARRRQLPVRTLPTLEAFNPALGPLPNIATTCAPRPTLPCNGEFNSYSLKNSNS